MNDMVKTPDVQRAMQMAEAVMAARWDARAGQIIGRPGLGKTAAGQMIAKEYNAIRICAWAKMGRRAIVGKIGEEMGISARYTADAMTDQILQRISGRLLIVDEANHLRWDVIEALRIFIDEGYGALILIGTDLLERTFRSARTEIYLAQMSQRIGAKRVTFKPMENAREIATFVLQPRFGEVSKQTASGFHKISKGNWRTALELADACERVMRAEKIDQLDEQLVQTAAAWMGGQ